MRKIIEKDKVIRKKVKIFEKKKIIFKSIKLNINFLNITRWNVNYSINKLPLKSSKTFITNRCINTINKKKFNKLTNFSRMVFLKLVRSRCINNVHKATW